MIPPMLQHSIPSSDEIVSFSVSRVHKIQLLAIPKEPTRQCSQPRCIKHAHVLYIMMIPSMLTLYVRKCFMQQLAKLHCLCNGEVHLLMQIRTCLRP